MESVAPRAIMAGSITASALFRIIDLKGPTLLIDEAGTNASIGTPIQNSSPSSIPGTGGKGAFGIVERGGLSWCQSCERAAQQG